MRTLTNRTKDAGTIAVGLPLMLLSALGAAAIMTGALVATKLIDRLTR